MRLCLYCMIEVGQLNEKGLSFYILIWYQRIFLYLWYRNIGIMKIGILKYWDFVIFWYIWILKEQNIVILILVYWYIGTLKYCNIEILGYLNFWIKKHYIEILEYLNIWILKYWDIEIYEYLSNEILGFQILIFL